MNQNGASVDYLQKLTTEVCHEVFSLALLSPSFPDSPFPFEPLSLNFNKRHEEFIAAQSSRAHLLLLCKRLLPILEQILFTDVSIKGPKQYAKFTVRAAAVSSNQRRLGEFTKCMRIQPNPKQPVSTDLNTLLVACPNLRSLEIGEHVKLPTGLGTWTQSRASSLQHLYWHSEDLSWEDLQKISVYFPRLSQLVLMACKEEDRQAEPIVFPDLQHFAVSSHCSEHFDISKITMPCLEKVTMQLSAYDGEVIDEFFQIYGPKIKSLEFTPGEGLTDTLCFPLGCHELFDICPNLETFSFMADMFDPIKAPKEAEIKQHPTLAHLKMAIWEPDEYFHFEEHAKFFSTARFPGLKHVTGGPGLKFEPDDFREVFQNLYPDAFVEVELADGTIADPNSNPEEE